MKVLNWITRRLVQSCSTFPQDDGVESKYVKAELHVETHALLEHGAYAVVNVVEDWRDGILAIGTLAIGPLVTGSFEIVEEVDDTNDHHHEDNHVFNDLPCHNLKNDGDDVGSNPLMNVELFSHQLEKQVNENKEIIEEEVAKNVVVELEENEIISCKRRVTLADLLSADSDHHLVKRLGDKRNHADVVAKDIAKVGMPCFKMIKPTGAKSGLSKAKKLLKEELRPLKKLNQLMKRVMKKKIHPDMEGKMPKDIEMQPSNADVDNPTQSEAGTNGSASSLLIRVQMP